MFVAMLKLGMADVVSVSSSRSAQLWGGLRLMAEGLSQSMRVHRVELQ